MIKVKRPSEITEFGGEWVKAYEKDSWENVTNEYEPFTFNDFGSKIPLQEFRATTKDGHGRTIVDDAAPVDAIHVFMVMDKVGDYEVPPRCLDNLFRYIVAPLYHLDLVVIVRIENLSRKSAHRARLPGFAASQVGCLHAAVDHAAAGMA